MLRSNFRKILLLLLIFLISLFPRIYNLAATPIFPDEVTWMTRGKEQFLALRTFNPTYIYNFFNGENAWWRITNDTQAISFPLTILVGPFISYLGFGQSVLTRNIMPDYVAARLPVAVVNSFAPVVIFLLVDKLLKNKKLALVTAFLYAFDPLILANSRLVLNDGLLTLFIVLGIYAYFYIDNVYTAYTISAVSLAFAFTTKPNGILLILPWAIHLVMNKSKKELKKILLIIFIAIVIVQIVWPESWHYPVYSIFEYTFRQTHIVSLGLRTYFLGVMTASPPFSYYLVHIFMRIPLYILFGEFLFIIYSMETISRFKTRIFLNKYSNYLAIAIFSIVFFLILSWSSSKLGTRYILPIWPFIYISSVWAIFRFLQEELKRKFMRTILLTAVLVEALYNVVLYFPNYDYYYNELFRNSEISQYYTSAGLCYGARESVLYIRKCFPSAHSFAYLGCSKPIVPYIYPYDVNDNWQGSDIVVIEESRRILARGSNNVDDVKYFMDKTPVKIIKENGLTLSRIYLNNIKLENVCKEN